MWSTGSTKRSLSRREVVGASRLGNSSWFAFACGAGVGRFERVRCLGRFDQWRLLNSLTFNIQHLLAHVPSRCFQTPKVKVSEAIECADNMRVSMQLELRENPRPSLWRPQMKCLPLRRVSLSSWAEWAGLRKRLTSKTVGRADGRSKTASIDKRCGRL